MEFVKVRKGTLETKINVKQLQHYIVNGWEEVKEEAKQLPDTYDKYNVKQLKEIAGNRNVTINSKMKKSDIVEALIERDEHKEMITNKHPNEGFTDNLIND